MMINPHERPEAVTKPPGYQPSKAELEADVSVPVSPERLASAVLKGGAPRRED